MIYSVQIEREKNKSIFKHKVFMKPILLKPLKYTAALKNDWAPETLSKVLSPDSFEACFMKKMLLSKILQLGGHNVIIVLHFRARKITY